MLCYMLFYWTVRAGPGVGHSSGAAWDVDAWMEVDPESGREVTCLRRFIFIVASSTGDRRRSWFVESSASTRLIFG